MAIGIQTNIRRVKKSVEDEQSRYLLRTRALARKMAATGRNNVRSNISSPTFPGYAITGALAKKVVASEPQRTGSGWAALVRVLLTGKQAKYALIHELGGRIEIKNPAQLRAMFASLRRCGQLRASRPAGGRQGLRYIKIRRKGYFAKGIEKTRREWSAERLKREF